MAFRRTYRRRPMKRTNRRRTFKKSINRKTTIPRALGYPKQNVYYFSRHCELTNIIAPADGADTLDSLTFSLVDLPAPTDFTNLFDWYKINYVVIKFLPYFNTVNAPGSSITFTTTSSANNMRIFTAIDYNDDTVPANINAIREYKNCKVTRYTQGQTRKFKPRPTLVSDDATPDVQYPIGNPWISTDTTGDDVAHFGLKLGIDTSLLPAAQIAPNDVLLKIECIYYIACKSPR